MLEQEQLYQLIFNEQWTEILKVLYSQKVTIANDYMLKQAALVFEQEFFKKLKNYPLPDKAIEENLDSLYVLNYGRYYHLSDEHYKVLIQELVKRKKLPEAINYARHFPEDEICKQTILQFEELAAKESNSKPGLMTNASKNWIEIYNRLFELIDNQSDTATYFSGPRFINTVKEYSPYFPTYTQFIEQRNNEGKSTSRKIYYYDILVGLKDEIRLKVVNRFLEILRPFQKEKVAAIDELLGHKVANAKVAIDAKVIQEAKDNPIVFISYSWDDETHKAWVLNLAERLSSNGIEVILDRYYLQPGKNLPHFIENSIARAKRVIIIFTPNYKLKADKRAGGVGYEYSIMNSELYNNQTTNEKIIPVLRIGSKEESIPAFMQQFIHIDIRNDDNFENSYVDLVREIYNEPAIRKPAIGEKPIFKNFGIKGRQQKPVPMDISLNGNDKIEGNINPAIVSKLRFNDTPVLTLSDGRKINVGTLRREGNYLVHYTGKGLREMYNPSMTEEEKKVASYLQSQSEEYLIENGYVARTPLASIVGINRDIDYDEF